MGDPLIVRTGILNFDRQIDGLRSGGRAEVGTITYPANINFVQDIVGVNWAETGGMWIGGADTGLSFTADSTNPKHIGGGANTGLTVDKTQPGAVDGGCFSSMWGKQWAGGKPTGQGVWLLGGLANNATAGITSSLDGGMTVAANATFPDPDGSVVEAFSYDITNGTFYAIVHLGSPPGLLGHFNVMTSADGLSWQSGEIIPTDDLTIRYPMPGLVNTKPTLASAKVARLGAMLRLAALNTIGDGNFYAAGRLKTGAVLAKAPAPLDFTLNTGTISLSPLNTNATGGSYSVPYNISGISIAGGMLWVGGYHYDNDNLTTDDITYAVTDGTEPLTTVFTSFNPATPTYANTNTGALCAGAIVTKAP